MKNSLLNSQDISIDYRYIVRVSTCYLFTVVLSFYSNIVIMVPDSRVKVVKIIGVFPVYELNHLSIYLLLCVQLNLNPIFLCY